jgi:predicted nucleic acid-binding protein
VIVFADTNIFYPVSLADLLLRAAEFQLIQLAWTDELLQEIQKVLIHEKGLPRHKARKFAEQIRRTAPNGEISPTKYSHLIASMTAKDVDDHAHAAAARGGYVDVLLTSNVRDFIQADVGSHCRVLRPDELFSELAIEYSIEFVKIVSEMSANLRNPPRSVPEVLERLRMIGLPNFADVVTGRL